MDLIDWAVAIVAIAALLVAHGVWRSRSRKPRVPNLYPHW